MPTRNIDLTDRHDRFVESLITSGQFSSANEVLGAGLRLLERQAQEHQEKLAALRALAAEAFAELDAGLGTKIDSPEHLHEVIAQIGRRVEENAQRAAGV